MPIADDSLDLRINRLDTAAHDYATRAIDEILAWGQAEGASDIHFQPTAEGMELKYRIDGVLRCFRRFPSRLGINLVCRLKVMAELLTYQTESPQEGRLRNSPLGASGGGNGSPGPTIDPNTLEMRLSTFPTLYGERAVVRVFSGPGRYRRLDNLGFPDDVAAPLGQLLGATSGAILVSGPAGSGKTTTVYACLREIAAAAGGARSLVSLEDPIEVAVEGVAQSQINPRIGFDLSTGLRFLMRQDPEVIMVGEIRDRATAEAAFEASLTGHLLLSTFHAGVVAEALGRLADMGIEPYVIRSGLLAVVSQRLVRRLCSCAPWSDRPEDRLGFDAPRVRVPVGCPECLGTGYRERIPLVEMVATRRAELSEAILQRADAAALRRAAVAAGMIPQRQRAGELIAAGATSPAEIRRVLGLGHDDPSSE
ncbi:MAG: Flp pilus assembly complex ATPase component TadA [Pirellulales bacterium]|nr:Flp pilus assembly complex ATPase component TadA [Pirellulales bacterium]